MFSATVIGRMNDSWSTIAIWARKLLTESERTSWPSIVIRPDHGSKKRNRRLTSVLFPAPVAPTIA